MAIEFDHLVVAARTLEEGAAWVEARLGAAMTPGGKHATMSTHNRLLSLGPGRFLEVIAVDPDAPPPGRPRWFELDRPAMRERLARGPALVHWVARAADLEGAIAATAAGRLEVLELSRGDYRWRIGVPASGSLALGGVSPTMIRWEGMHPAERLPESGCWLERLTLRHREAPALLRALAAAGLDPASAIDAVAEGEGLAAQVRTPGGIVTLGGEDAATP